MFATDAHAATAVIQQRKPDFQPKLGLILGSGLANIAELIDNPVIIPYQELPGFFQSGIEGHPGKLYLGTLQNVPIACLQGRVHLYEGIASTVIHTLIRTLKLLGCETLLLTNSAGSLRTDISTGMLMAISDHINFQFTNALAGNNNENFGPRFVSMDNAYDKNLRTQLEEIAKREKIPLASGVYLGTLGPSFETPAEIRAFQIMGADAVGMSTIQEVIVARHCDLKVAAISVITNMAAGLNKEMLSHEQTLRGAAAAMKQLTQLILAFVAELSHAKS